MNFDFGSVLTRAWQITWKHKVLWVLSALPMFVSFLTFPLFFLPAFFLSNTSGQGGMSQSTATILSILVFIVLGIMFVGSFLLSGVSMSATTLGVVRAERGEGDLSLVGLLNDGKQYFGRIIIVLLIINLTIGLVFTLFFLMVIVLTLVTMGIASICLQPIMILLTPLSFLSLAVMESAEAAVIVDDMSALDAVKRGLSIVRENVWKYVIMTLIIYFGTSIIMSFIMTPFMVPFFALSFFSSSTQHFNPEMMLVVMFGFMCLFFPFIIAFQSVAMTFLKSSLCLTYMHFAKPGEDRPVFVSSNIQTED